MPSYAFFNVKISRERLTRRVLCCEMTTLSFVFLLWIGSIVAGLMGEPKVFARVFMPLRWLPPGNPSRAPLARLACSTLFTLGLVLPGI